MMTLSTFESVFKGAARQDYREGWPTPPWIAITAFNPLNGDRAGRVASRAIMPERGVGVAPSPGFFGQPPVSRSENNFAQDRVKSERAAMTLAEALSTLDGKAELTGEDALTLRKVIYGADIVLTQVEADAVFKLNADAGAISPEWAALFSEAMADFVVRQQEPEGFVDDAKADWLISSVKRHARIREDEVEMLLHVVELADQTPARLSDFVLQVLKGLALWKLEHRGALERVDIDRLRRALFAAGGDGSIAVSRHEAEVLFDINDALKGKAVDPAWTDLFVHAVANAVLFETPWAPDLAREKREEAWTKDTSIHPLRRMERLAETPSGIADALKEGAHLMGRIRREALDFDFSDPEADKRTAEQVAAEQAREAASEEVTADEAHWLLGRLGRHGQLDANERALVAFIRANATSVDASLQGALANAEAPAAATTPPTANSDRPAIDRPVFGHRQSAVPQN
jgi:hypothetical protein